MEKCLQIFMIRNEIWFCTATLELCQLLRRVIRTADGFVVHNENETTHVFRPSKKGLFYLDKTNDVGTVFVHTVDSNKHKFSLRFYSEAVKSCELYFTIGRQVCGRQYDPELSYNFRKHRSRKHLCSHPRITKGQTTRCPTQTINSDGSMDCPTY